jgi:protein pelota
VRLPPCPAAGCQPAPAGSHHTLELEAPRKFTLEKAHWDSVALDMVKEATADKATADLAAVVMEMGLAHVCLVTKTMTLVKQKVELSVPRKRAGSTQHEKQRDKFFDYIIAALLQHIDWSMVKAVIVASPGFVKDQFMDYMLAQFSKRAAELQPLNDNKNRFIRLAVGRFASDNLSCCVGAALSCLLSLSLSCCVDA